jgi:hypothetical protein
MFTILNALADDAIATTEFCCDLTACKGACCTMPGGRGAPLADGEVQAVNDSITVALPYLSPEKRAAIAALGAVEGEPGDYTTRCMDERDCVFVYYDGQIAKCAIERAFFEGRTEFRKPISCHLFPIRVNDLFGGPYLRYERISECAQALANGREKGVPLYRFLHDALVRAFGQEFYDTLVERIEKKPDRKRQKRSRPT